MTASGHPWVTQTADSSLAWWDIYSAIMKKKSEIQVPLCFLSKKSSPVLLIRERSRKAALETATSKQGQKDNETSATASDIPRRVEGTWWSLEQHSVWISDCTIDEPTYNKRHSEHYQNNTISTKEKPPEQTFFRLVTRGKIALEAKGQFAT